MTTDEANDDSGRDLGWLADRFVLGELGPEDEERVLARLGHDHELAAAVARSSTVVATLRKPRPTFRRSPASRRPWRLAGAFAALAAAVAVLVCWRAVVPRPWPSPDEPGPRDVVRIWRQAEEVEWAADDAGTEEESADGDVVPDWMLAAVGLDGPAVSDETVVREN